MRFFQPSAEVVRMRVVANSDTDEDQAAKLAVRDAVLSALTKQTLKVRSIRSIARSVEPSARVRFGRQTFEGCTTKTLLITLGAGAGQNWWGILFPAACHLPVDSPWHFESFFVSLFRRWGWL